VDSLGEEIGQRRVDGALTLDAVLAGEGGGDDLDREMAFAARIVAGMAAMPVAVVDHGEPFGSEGGAKALGDFLGHGAGASI
jgi:hypothetical protein